MSNVNIHNQPTHSRGSNRANLIDAGADVVVADLAQLSGMKCNMIQNWVSAVWGLNDAFPYTSGNWTLHFDTSEVSLERTIEALATLGNAYMATRGSVEEVDDNEDPDVRYPGNQLYQLTIISTWIDIILWWFLLISWKPTQFKHSNL
jgi:hypothetical protein